MNNLIVLLLSFASFALALASIAAVVLVAAGAARWPGRMFHYLMLLGTVAGLGKVLFSERVLRFAGGHFIVEHEADIGSHPIANVLMVAVLGLAIALCLAWVFSPRSVTKDSFRFAGKGFKAPTDIVTAFLVFCIAFNILPIFLGARYYFHPSLIYPFFVYLALFLWVRVSTVDPAVVAKQCLGLIIFGSFVAAVLAPQVALQSGYIGPLPGLDSRFWGLAPHANALGAVASVLLVLEAAQPSARRWLGRGVLAAAALALIMTQSKTSILAAALGLSVVYCWRLLAKCDGRTFYGQESGGRDATAILLTGLTVSIVVAASWAMFANSDVVAPLERYLQEHGVDDLATATGRTWIWEVAIQGGLESPVFGQGGDFWNLDLRRRLGLTGGVNAHNLFLEVFSRSGFVGLAALLLFLYFLIAYSIRAAKATGGGSIGLMAVFLTRAVFEVAFQLNTILGVEMAAYLFLVIDRGAKTTTEPTQPNPLLTTTARL